MVSFDEEGIKLEDRTSALVKGYPGWYIPAEYLDRDEVNFRVDYFVVAVDDIPSIGKGELVGKLRI